MPDWDAEGLLNGLTDERARAARRRLLDRLHTDGVAIGELRKAVAEDRLVLLPTELLLADQGPRYTALDVFERVEVDPELLLALRRAIGLPTPDPDVPEYSEEDVEAINRAAQLLKAGVSREDLVETMRVLGSGMARYVEAIHDSVARALTRPGDTELEAAERIAAGTRTLLPLAGRQLERVFRQHLLQTLRSDAITAQELASGRLGGAQEVTVAFADLVGFTELGEQVDEDQLSSVATRLAQLAAEVVHQPARIVKTIGDAVMLVAPESPALLSVCADLVDAAEADTTLPSLRAGLAAGPAVNRFGDWYGSTVNVASRVCGRARPGSILVTEPVKDAAANGGFAFSAAGPKRLKGVGPTPLWRARRQSS